MNFSMQGIPDSWINFNLTEDLRSSSDWIPYSLWPSPPFGFGGNLQPLRYNFNFNQFGFSIELFSKVHLNCNSFVLYLTLYFILRERIKDPFFLKVMVFKQAKNWKFLYSFRHASIVFHGHVRKGSNWIGIPHSLNKNTSYCQNSCSIKT